jgi:hypothetical protein
LRLARSERIVAQMARFALVASFVILMAAGGLGCGGTSSKAGAGGAGVSSSGTGGHPDGGLPDATGGAAGAGGAAAGAGGAAGGDAGTDSGHCDGGVPDPTTAPATIDVSCFVPTFDDDFLAYDISSGPVDDGDFPNERWFNGTEQCCLSPSDGSHSANYPTPSPSGPVNPYTLIPGGGLQIMLQKLGDTWYSGVMTSVDKNGNGFSQKYGYIEYSAKLAPGTGTWPGLWMLSMPLGAQGGEIDILEQYGGNPPLNPDSYTHFQTTLHDWTNTSLSVEHTVSGQPDLTAGYHRFGLLWGPTYTAVYVDAKLAWSTPTLAIMKRPYYLLADMGLGSGWTTTQTPNPSDLLIKYIRAYSVPGF